MASDPTAVLGALIGTTGQGYNGLQQVQQDNQAQQFNAQRLQLGQMQLAAAQQEQQRAEEFQHDTATYYRDPSPQNLANLAIKYPEQAKQLKESYSILQPAQLESRKAILGQLWNSAKNGRADLVAQNLDNVIKAEKAAGLDTSEAEAARAQVSSGDPEALKAVQAFAQMHLAAADTKFAESIGAISDGKDNAHVVGRSIGHYENGKYVVDYRDPDEPKIIKNADGTESIVQLGGGGDPTSGGGAPSGSGGALTTRLNNPGAIRYSKENDWKGQVGQENGFVKFATAADGERAHRVLIANQIKGGYDTPIEWANHYAPASDGNDPAAYAQTIAKGLGIGVNDKIPLSAVPKMAALSAQVESGGTPAPNGGTQTASGARVLYTSKGGGNTDTAPGDTSLTGEEYIATLPKSLAAQVKALSEGRLSIPTGAALRSPKVQQLWAAASQYDPELDQANAKTRAATRKEFTSGKAAANITSFNTVLHHIDDLRHVANDLNNGSIPVLNSIGNATSSALGGAGVAKFRTAKQAVVDELERAFRGSSGSLAGIKGWEETLSSSSSPAQINGVLNQMANLLAGRIEALGEQYTAGMGKSVDGINLLDSKARATLTSLADGYGGASQASATSGPVKVTTRAQAMALPPGTSFIDPHGVVRVRP